MRMSLKNTVSIFVMYVCMWACMSVYMYECIGECVIAALKGSGNEMMDAIAWLDEHADEPEEYCKHFCYVCMHVGMYVCIHV